ncbi:hypothetical protein [Chryseobacterium sp. ERMR1:04]|uniref:hypothetical protein n=1 Tax=Chryseobacterium sp. ERMR1:04 TaxID=1705393 RepID=UPI000F4FF924|nr:hypothetical protein [Chryseobacterium sp. ERMR1:04]
MEDLAVISTKFVLEDNSPIISVFKDNEGDWQFFGKEKDITEEDARVISLGEVLKIDQSIKDILTLNNGSHAWREAVGEEWKIEKYDE